MPKYIVTLQEQVRYTLEVEAKDKEEAHLVAEDAFVNSNDPYGEFDGVVEERETFLILEK